MQPQREFPGRRAALHAGRSPAARVRAGAERRLRDGELRATQPPSPAGAAASAPQRSPAPARSVLSANPGDRSPPSARATPASGVTALMKFPRTPAAAE